MAIIKYHDGNQNLVPLGATGDHSHSLESLGAAEKDHGHDVVDVTNSKDGFMSVADKTALNNAVENISKLQALVGNDNVPVSEKIADAFNAEMSRASTEEQIISGRLSVVEEDYLVAEDKKDLQTEIAAAENSAVDRVLGYLADEKVNESFDTLKEVAIWIESDTTDSVKLVNRVSAIEEDYLVADDKQELADNISENTENINILNGQVATKVEKSEFDALATKMPTSGTVTEFVAAAIDELEKDLNISQYATNTDLGKATDRISELEKLPQKDATTSDSGFMSAGDKKKLDGIADGANKYVHARYTSAASGLYNITVDSEGHVSAASKVQKSDITNLGIPDKNTEYKNATTSDDGLMSSTDKKTLDQLNTWVNGSVTEAINAAIETHSHSYAGSDSTGGAATSANKVNNSLTIKLNSGTTEGSNKFTFDGANEKTVNITPSSIGAATATTITSGSYDDVVNPGIYVMSNVSTKAPSTSSSYYTLIVGQSTRDSSSYVHQIAVQESTCTMYVRYRSSGTWYGWEKINPSAMTGATSSASGTTGLVPAPTTNDTGKYLRGDGTWQTPYTHPTGSGNNHIPSGGSSGQYLKYSSAGTATWADLPSTNITVDSALSSTSTNPVQNKVVESAISGLTSSLNYKANYNHSHTVQSLGIQYGSSGLTVPKQSYNSTTISFNSTYNSTPFVVASAYGNFDPSKIHIVVDNVSKTGFTIIASKEYDSLDFDIVNFYWIAIGAPS